MGERQMLPEQTKTIRYGDGDGDGEGDGDCEGGAGMAPFSRIAEHQSGHRAAANESCELPRR
jgi:hypothetical protein